MSVIGIDRTGERMTDFVELPWQIYPGKVRWVPPVRPSVTAELSPENPFFRHGEAQAFLCERDGVVVGRIVASIDHQLVDHPDTGFFGYFECIEDTAVANALLAAAEGWLAERGKRRIWGPINLGVLRGYRIQIQGFDTEPFLGEPRTPAYYRTLLEGAGYQVHARWNSWDIPTSKCRQVAWISWLNTLRHRLTRQGRRLRLAMLDFDHFERDLARLHALAMGSYQKNFAITAVDLQEFVHIFASSIAVRSADLIRLGFIVDGDRDVAFAYGYADLAPGFIAMDGDPGRMGALTQTPATAVVFHSFGVIPEYRRSGAAHMLLAEAFGRIGDLGEQRVTGALAKEGRTVYDRLGAPSRSYAVLEKCLVGPSP